ncbi:MAG: hypothetical protein JWM80_6637 [Cyanobacteria bacterium RYN_339]|nr:hypothetical protein [Cyanobacteria bacterium RYN_339]
MNWRRQAAMVAVCALSVGCAEAAPLAPPTAPKAAGAASAPDRHLAAQLLPPVTAAALTPWVWANAVGVNATGPTSGPSARYLAISLAAGRTSLPEALLGAPGTVFLSEGNTTVVPDGTQSMVGTITVANVVHNPGGGGIATLSGINSEGLPFTLTLADTNDPTKPDTISVNAPGLFTLSTNVISGDLRIVQAVPVAGRAERLAGVTYDNAIGLFIAQADADNGQLPPQKPVPAFASELTPPIPQAPLPPGAPTDTADQFEVHLLRNFPRFRL